MSMISSLLSELPTIERLIIVLSPVVVVVGVYFLFKVGALGPDPVADQKNNA